MNKTIKNEQDIYEVEIGAMVTINPVGVQNMRRIIQRNNWKEVF